MTFLRLPPLFWCVFGSGASPWRGADAAGAARLRAHAQLALFALLLVCGALPAACTPPANGTVSSWFATRAWGFSTRAGHRDGASSVATFQSGAGALALATNAAGDIYAADGPAIRLVGAGGADAVSTVYSNASMLFSAVCVDQSSGAVYAIDSLNGGGILWRVGPTSSNVSMIARPTDPLACWWSACAVDSSGQVVVSDAGTYALLRVDPSTGAQQQVAGCAAPGQVDGTGASACVHEVYSLSYNAATGSTLFANYGNDTTTGSVRQLFSNGTVSTLMAGLPFARTVLALNTSFYVMYTNLVNNFALQVYPATGMQYPVILANWVPDLQTGAPPSSLAVSRWYSQANLITASAKMLYFIGPASPPSPPPNPSPPPLPNSPPPPNPPSPPVRLHHVFASSTHC